MAACAALSPRAFALSGGHPGSEDPRIARSTIKLWGADGIFHCSGVLIKPSFSAEPDLVLTAAHCPTQSVAASGNGGVAIPPVDPGNIEFAGGETVASLEFERRSEQEVLYEGAKIAHPDDLMLILLAKPAPKGSVAVELAPSGAIEGKSVLIAGFGGDANGGAGSLSFDRVPVTEILDKTFRTESGEPSRHTWDGDSGGPAFIEFSGDTLALAGTLVGGTRPTQGSSVSLYTRVAAYRDWIVDTERRLRQKAVAAAPNRRSIAPDLHEIQKNLPTSAPDFSK